MTETKPVAELVRGDRVLMEEGDVRVVFHVGKGFAQYKHADGKTEPSLMIDWKDGSWSQVPKSFVATIAPREGKK